MNIPAKMSLKNILYFFRPVDPGSKITHSVQKLQNKLFYLLLRSSLKVCLLLENRSTLNVNNADYLLLKLLGSQVWPNFILTYSGTILSINTAISAQTIKLRIEIEFEFLK